MDGILGIEWLPSQIQFVNPVMIMLFILFSFIIYPAIDKVFTLTPIRKSALVSLSRARSYCPPDRSKSKPARL